MVKEKSQSNKKKYLTMALISLSANRKIKKKIKKDEEITMLFVDLRNSKGKRELTEKY